MSDAHRLRKSHNFSIYLTSFSVILLISGLLFLKEGSRLQNAVFLIGAALIAISAFESKNHMVTFLEAIIILGIITAFFPLISLSVHLLMILLPALGVIAFLSYAGYYRKERINAIATASLICFAFGFSLNAPSYVTVFSLFLSLGSFLFVVYGSLSFYMYKGNMQVPLVVLNAIFGVSSFILFLSSVR